MNVQDEDLKEVEAKQEEEQKKPEITVSVTSNKLEAILQVEPAFQGQVVTVEEVMACLKEMGIVYGVLNSEIQDFCENKKYFLDLVCARGLSPVDEKNGKLEYMFQKEQNFMPEEREDGTVDYRNLGIVQNVKKGDVLCKAIHPEPGKDGIDVYGKAIPYRRGKMPSFPQGKNTVISEDGLILSADTDGCIEYKNACLNISEVFIVRGDVDSSSGNVNFLGTVIVQGDVLEGFSVKAGGDINVRGTVEGALLDAGGSIAISFGMNGMGKGKLVAKGSISAQYIENAILECEGDIRADVILNCTLKAGHSILIRGRKGLLAGGHCEAGRSITANTIGSGGAHTEVAILSDTLNGLLSGKEGESLETVQAKLEEEEKKLATLDAQIATISAFLKKNPHSLKAKRMLQNVRTQKKQAESNIAGLKSKISAAVKTDQRDLSALDFKITALRVIYAGTKMTIGGFVETLYTDYNATKFYANNEHIVSAPIQPVDRS